MRHLSTALLAVSSGETKGGQSRKRDEAAGIVTTVITLVWGANHSETPKTTSKEFEDNQFLADEVPALRRKCSLTCRCRLVKWTIQVT